MDTAPPTILLVDDNPANRYVLKRYLERASFHVIEASTGKEALRRLEERPSLVVLDVKLPDIDGLEVCRRIKTSSEHALIPVIHTSATLIRSRDRVLGLEGGGDGYLTMPVEPDELIATVRALLRLRHAEEQLRSRELQLRMFVEHAPAAIAMFDRNMRYLVASRRWYTDYGLSGEIIGRSHYDVFEIPDRWKAVHEQCLRDAVEIAEEDRFVRPDGSVSWLKWEVRPWYFNSSEVGGLMIITEDVTEKRKVHERTRLLSEAATVLLTTSEPNLMLQELFHRIAPHFAIDIFLNYVADEANQVLRFESAAGLPQSFLQDMQVVDYGQAICGTVAQVRHPIHADRIQSSHDPLTRLVRPLGVQTYACYPLLSGQELLGTLSFASRTRESFGKDELEFLKTICHYVATVYERLRLLQRLREADRRKDEFLAMLAHELRNPLAPIANALQILRMTSPNEPVLEGAHDLIERQMQHLVRLIDDLLDVSRVSRGKIKLERMVLDLTSVVQHAVETSRPLIDARRHHLTIDSAPEAQRVYGDFTRLSQVISNLLNNAAKYTDEGGEIVLRVETIKGVEDQSDQVAIRVRDNGRGIEASVLGSLFELFYQVDRNLDRAEGGLGIGLSLVKTLVDMHGGSVEAHSAGKGFGSEFIVRLPLIPSTVLTPAVGAHPQTSTSRRSRRVLVVDDNSDSAMTMAALLRLDGHQVTVAYDGRKAVEVALRDRPDIVLLDIGLPYLDGYQACQEMRSGGMSDALIVAMTGYGQQEDRHRSQAAAFDAHLVKPVDIGTVRQLVEAHP